MTVSTVAILAFLWVIASALVALLPMRRQYAPGLVLLLAAPVLIFWLGIAHNWIVGTLALMAFVSVFRNPLIYLGKRAVGRSDTRQGEGAE